jgi:hypothetical protein
MKIKEIALSVFSSTEKKFFLFPFEGGEKIYDNVFAKPIAVP